MAKERKIKEIQTGGGAGRRVLAFFLGLLFGIILIFGALGGAVYYVYTRPIKDTVKLLDGNESNGTIYQLLFGDGTSTGYLSADYAAKTVGDLIKDTTTAVQTLTNGGSLSALEGLSPKVRTTVRKLLEQTDAYAVPLDEETLMTTPINELGSYVGTQLKETPAGALLKAFNEGVETEDPILLALCYGEEGVDYTTVDGEIVMLNGTNGTTLRELFGGTGVSDQIDKVPLEAIADDASDPIIRTLAYGPASHYDTVTDADGNIVRVEMKQMVFTWENSKLYDIDGEEVDGSFDEATKVLTLTTGEVYYLETKAKTSSEATYYLAFTDEERTSPALYKKLTVGDFTEDAEGLVDGLYLSDALNVNESSHQVLISLAYGAEGEQYTVNEDGTIKLNDGVTPRTIGDLKAESNDLINDIYLKDVLNVTPESHKVLISLAYGKKDIDYEIVDVVADGEIVSKKFEMKEGKTPKTLGDISGENSSNLINDIYIADALDVTPSSHRVLISLAYGHEGVNYDIVDGVIEPRSGEENQPRTLADLSGENSEELINGIYLADALNVTPESDSVLITLAYGKKGRDYVIEDGTFVMKKGAPRTLADLSGDISPLLDDIELADVMDPDFDSPIIMYLLYGREGIHYKVETKDGEKVAVPLQQRIAIFGENAYNPYGELLTGSFDDGKLKRELDTTNYAYTVTVTDDEGTETKTVYKYDPDAPIGTLEIAGVGTATYYYLTDEDSTPVYYEPTCLGELSGEDSTISLLTKRLTIKELLGDEETQDNIFLKHVQNETIDTLPDAINDLTFTDVYAQDIYKTVGIGDSSYSPDANGEKSYFIDKNGDPVKDANGNIVYTGDDISTVKDNLVVTSTWWYLLHNDEQCHKMHCKNGSNCPNTASECTQRRTCEINSCGLDDEACHVGNKEQGGEHLGHCHLGDSCPYNTEEDDGTCQAIPDCSRKGCIYDYKITDFDALVTNMTDNMKDATLLCLEHDGIVELSAEELHTSIKSEIDLSSLGMKSIPIDTPNRTEIKTDANGEAIKDEDGNPVYAKKVYLYEMTINEILTYASSVLEAISTLETTLNRGA